MTSQLSFVEWLEETLRLIGSDRVSVHVRRRTESLLEASVSSVLSIDGGRQGVRRAVILAIDEGAGGAAVERFCLEHSSQIGVVEAFLLSNGPPDEPTGRVLARYRVRSVVIAGGAGFTMPTAGTTGNFEKLLLGRARVAEISGRLERIRQALPATEAGEGAEGLLHSAYSTLLALYFTELGILAEDRESRLVVHASQSGVEAAMSGGYAVESWTAGESGRSVYLPDPSSLDHGLSLAVGAHQAALSALRAGHDGPLAQLVGRVSGEFVSYYLAWMDGRCHELPLDRLRAELAGFVGAPHISVLSARLPELMPSEQIPVLTLLGRLDARDATGDLVAALDSMVPKVQETCLRTLGDLGTLDDLSVLTPFLLSRRESLRDAAVAVIGRSGGDGAARYLIELLNADRVPLSESTLNAIGSTRSVLALGSLIRFGAGRGQVEPPLLDAVERCLASLDTAVLRRDGPRYVPADVLEGYVAFLFATGEDPPRRLALKLIAAFDLAAGVAYVEQALLDESLVTRLHAIRAVALLSGDRLVRAMTDSVASLPEDYRSRQLLAWLTANIRVGQHGDGPGGRIDSVTRLDLRAAVAESLTAVGSDLASACLEELPPAGPDSDGEAPRHDGQPDWRSTPLMNSVFACPDDLVVWVSHSTAERAADEVATATLVHGNRFEDSQGMGESASMLSGGLSSTQGTETEILENVVFRCLRGEQPRFPVSVGMGEHVTTRVDNGRTVIEGRGELDRAEAPPDGE
ncbi:HEAT repeat domain-containing protein [Streptomyces sp. NPDC001068]|uniref:HEAT repeat domain-containing protein n=1 Tax=Streptomyces sp. NPDC001068 TaxID=3364544 RepID=UPI0036C1E2BA